MEMSSFEARPRVSPKELGPMTPEAVGPVGISRYRPIAVPPSRLGSSASAAAPLVSRELPRRSCSARGTGFDDDAAVAYTMIFYVEQVVRGTKVYQ